MNVSHRKVYTIELEEPEYGELKWLVNWIINHGDSGDNSHVLKTAEKFATKIL